MTKRIAILDLYNNEPNEGMRCIKQIIENFGQNNDTDFVFDVFDVRHKTELPTLHYDIYISTGGPGSPTETTNDLWEQKYFELIDALLLHNKLNADTPKYLFLICHSFQLFCKHYELGNVTKRKSTSFGVMPMHKTDAGSNEPFFDTLPEPFWAVDSRDWQVTQPNEGKIMAWGGAILAIEKDRPAVRLERAVMAIRFTDAVFGTQFHPEADPVGMLQYLHREDKKAMVIKNHGIEKYNEMTDRLDDDDKIVLTHHTILPNFLKAATNQQAIMV
jgi:GMP synthase-like glutamine amidotransferase